MKKIIIILIILFNIAVKGQAPANAPVIALTDITTSTYVSSNAGTYFKDVGDKFLPWLGTWKYDDGSTIFKIVLQKIDGLYFPAGTNNIPISCYMDVIIGGYFYQENGIEKTNHLIYAQLLEPPLFVYGVDPIQNKLTLYYDEIDKNPDLTGWFVNLTMLPGSTTQAKWVFDSVKKRNYSVPDEIILTKE